MRTWIRCFVLVSLFICGGAEAVRLMSPEEFTRRMVAEIQKEYPDLDVHVDGELAASYKSHAPGDKTVGHAYFDNAYREYSAHRDQLEQVVAAHVRSIRELDKDARCDPAAVLPAIKSQEYMVGAAQLMAAEDAKTSKTDEPKKTGKGPLSEAFVGDLVILYVRDSASSTRTLGEDDLKDCQLERKALRATALANLQTKAKMMRLSRPPNAPGIVIVNGDQYYETSMLLLDDFWTPQRFPVKGELVVAMPARGWLMVADSEDDAAVKGMAGIAARAFKNEPYSLTPKLYRRQASTWIEYKP